MSGIRFAGFQCTATSIRDGQCGMKISYCRFQPDSKRFAINRPRRRRVRQRGSFFRHSITCNLLREKSKCGRPAGSACPAGATPTVSRVMSRSSKPWVNWQGHFRAKRRPRSNGAGNNGAAGTAGGSRGRAFGLRSSFSLSCFDCSPLAVCDRPSCLRSFTPTQIGTPSSCSRVVQLQQVGDSKNYRR